MIVYTSDQGFFLGDHGLFDKRLIYEESIRMPFLVRWPARIAPGTKSDAIGLNIDSAATFLDVAGLPHPRICKDAVCWQRSVDAPVRLADLDVLPLLPRPWRSQYESALRGGTRTHKLIYFWKKDSGTSSISLDPHELHSLYGETGQETLTLTLKNRACED